MVQVMMPKAEFETVTMMELTTTHPKLPVVKIERKTALKVNTSTVQFIPRTLPMCNPNTHSNDTLNGAVTVNGKKLCTDIKVEDWVERLQNKPPYERHWETKTWKSFTSMTARSIQDVARANKTDEENFPVIRSKSAPTKLVYMDKAGNLSRTTKGDNRLTRSCRAAIGRRKDSIARGGTSESGSLSLGYSQTKVKEIPSLSRAKTICSDLRPSKTVFTSTHVYNNGIDVTTNNDATQCNIKPDTCIGNTSNESSVHRNDGHSHGKCVRLTTLRHRQRTVDGIAEIAKARAVRDQTPMVHQRIVDHLKWVVVPERKRNRPVIVMVTSDEDEDDVDYKPVVVVEAVEEPPKPDYAGLFHNVIHFVRMVVRLLVSMTDLSVTIAPRSATEERWHALNTSRAVRDMAFNKTAFAKRKGFYRLPRWAKLILDKYPDDRTEADVRRIHALLRGLKSFDKFTEKIQLSMCRSFTYHSVCSGRIILRQGHVGLNFYFLYTGSVFVNTDDTDAQGNSFSKTEVVLRRGDSFGELALLQDIRRTATVSCREDCELLVVDKDTFAKVCPKIFEREMEEKVKFMSRLPLFNPKYWGKEAIEKMCFEAQIQEYKTNKVVVKDNATDDWIYICMNGKCQVIRRLDLEEEIEWRKLQQSAVARLADGADKPDEFEHRGSIADRGTYCDDDESRSGASDNFGEGKEHMLQSMGLEYRNARKLSVGDIRHLIDLQKAYRQNSAKQEKGGSIDPLSSEQGQLTLTTLIRQEGASGQEYLYLNIKSLQEGDVFDLCTVLSGHRGEVDTSGSYLLVSNGTRVMRIKRASFFNPATPQCLNHAKKITPMSDLCTVLSGHRGEVDASGSYLLVSNGARVMRMKRASFFKHATPQGLNHARKITKRHRLPPDDVLLRCYRDQLNWQVYKQMVLKDTYGAIQHEKGKTHGNARFTYNDTCDEINIDIDEAKKQTIKDIQHVLPDEEPTDPDVIYWKQLETLSNNKLIKECKRQKMVAFQLDPEYETRRVTIHVSDRQDMTSAFFNSQNTPHGMVSPMYVGQRRGSVATGDLRRENLRQNSARRRFSQQNTDFASIEEEDDDFLTEY